MSDEERDFGPLIAGLLAKLRQGDQEVADQLWDVSSNSLPPDKQQQLEKLVHDALDKLDQ